ncbi:amidase [Emydomyces testavorans]|uniref:amidase n=1 Tax=Emydomyces testavorans TaxID=2070801 RepID=A0AAF0DMD1_9EURO|nr:amidase [Emydomyces testavorans]
MAYPHWKPAVLKKRMQQKASIPKEWHLLSPVPSDVVNTKEFIDSSTLLSPEEKAITNITDATVLLSKLASRELSSEQVALAFCKRAALAHQLTNCCTEMFFDRAISCAKALDDHLRKTGKLKGPLHGLPISIKDGFDIEGIDTTLGWVGLIGKPAPRNGCMAELLLSMGAVIYCKTNIPQSLMMSDSYNHVFGQSLNALNRNLISGGSSGGEGAVVAAQGSIIGIGSDIGGSIRIPATLQGLYSLTPSAGRIPWERSLNNQSHIVPPVAGPMTTSLNSLEFFTEAFISNKPWEREHRALPIPWRKELADAPAHPLKIGIVFDDGIVKPQPPVARALREVAEKFHAAGHDVIEWDTSSHVKGLKLWLKSVLADGGAECERLCDLVDEPLIQGMLVGQAKDRLTQLERQELDKAKHDYRTHYLRQWRESHIDALIMPVLPWVAYTPKTWVKSRQWLGYTAIFNLLDYAVVTVPVTKVDPSLDAPSDEWRNHKPRNESDAFNHEQYDLELVKGMPICVQIITGRFGEERGIAVAKVMEQL